MIRNIVEERKLFMEKTGEKSSGSPIDVIHVLLSDTKESSDNTQKLPRLPSDITENIIEMMIAGEDSVPMVMTLAVKYLSDNPVALSRVVVCSFLSNYDTKYSLLELYVYDNSLSNNKT